MDENFFIGNNSAEDVSWLSSLSESELDILISLKKLVLQRAKVVGHESLAKKFDLKTLRALGFILMQHVKDKVNELHMTGLNGSKDVLDGCNLLELDIKSSNQRPATKDFTTHMEMDKKRKRGRRSSRKVPEPKKQRRND